MIPADIGVAQARPRNETDRPVGRGDPFFLRFEGCGIHPSLGAAMIAGAQRAL